MGFMPGLGPGPSEVRARRTGSKSRVSDILIHPHLYHPKSTSSRLMAATTSHHPQPLRPSTANPGLKKPAHHPPTTPLRRISRGSLSALSASRSREVEDGAEPLEHLFHVFAELSEGFEDLAVNFEALNAVCESLDSFNEGFASFLYGLRVNAYTTEFVDVRAYPSGLPAGIRGLAQEVPCIDAFSNCATICTNRHRV